jgi:hypothetical protein
MSKDTGRAKLPALPAVAAQDLSLRNWINAVNERLEVREGSRGNPAERVVTQRELDALTSKVRVLQTSPTAAPGQTLVPIGGGMHAAIDIAAFADALRNTRLYRDLTSKIDDPTRFETLAAQTRDVLLGSIASEALKRGAEIRRTEVTLQTADASLALAVSEITAALGTSGAGIRTVEEAYATLNTAQAAKVTQLEASLGNYYADGTAGRAVLEDTLLTDANRITGLQAQRTIKVSAGGAVAGIGLAATDPVAGTGDSAIIMVANKLAFVTPSAVIGTGVGEINPSSPDLSLIPFGVDASGVYINGQVRINASGPLLDSFSSGTDGKSTFAAPVYKRSATALTAPTGGTFDFAANVLTPPAGWSVSPPAGTDPIYVSTTTFSVIGQTATATAGTWGTPVIYVQNGANGTSGLSTFLYPVFLRGATAPATPTGGSYNFTTNVGTPPASWGNTVPTGTDPIYTSSAMASVSGPTGTAAALTWSAPTILAQNGVKGDTGTGLDGPRGSITGYGATYGLYYSSSWADNSVAVSTYQANRVIQNMLLGQSLTTDLTTTTHLRIGDTVTLGNSATPTAVITKYWSGSGWVSPGVIIDGNLLVNGSVSAGKIDTTGLTIKDGSGNVIFSSGVPIDYTRVGGTKPPSNADNTSSNIAAGISGQGALATMSRVPGTYIDNLLASQITADTVTGWTIQTAASGERIVLNGAANKLQAFDAANTSRLEIGGSTGSLYATGNYIPAIYGKGTYDHGAYFINDAVSTKNAVFAQSNNNAAAMQGEANASYTGHGLLGKWGSVAGYVGSSYGGGKAFYGIGDSYFQGNMTITGNLTVNGTYPGSGGSAGVSSFNSRTGTVSLTASDVTSALGSTAVQNAQYAATGGSITTAAQIINTLGNNQVGYATNAVYATGSTYSSYVSNSSGAYLQTGSYTMTLQTDGNVVASSGGTSYWSAHYGWTSDRRHKTNIALTTQSGIAVINQLEVVDFTWKETSPLGDGGKPHTGFIAQDVGALIPDAAGDVGGTYLLNKGEIVPLLVKAVQELSAEVALLRTKINLT